MRLLWRDRWIEVPAPGNSANGLLLKVEATVPLGRVENASGRTIRRPGLKVLRFLLSDGPRATLRKARGKRRQAAYLDDYWLVAVLGREWPDGDTCLALAPRSASCAELLPVHHELCRTLPGAGEDELRRLVAAVRPRMAELAPFCRQSYLHSGEDPPQRLREVLDAAVAAASEVREPTETAAAQPKALRPRRGERVERLMTTGRGPGRRSAVALLGAGDYARMEIVPALRRARLRLAVLCDREPQIAALAARETGFEASMTDPFEAIGRLERRSVVVIATYHDSHARLAAAALEAGHRVLLEKPAVVTHDDLDLLLAAAEHAPGELEVGFNRRYNPLVRSAAKALAAEEGPLSMVCSIREVSINPDHWYFWPNQGTRVAGNLCHWIDLAINLLGQGPVASSVTVSPQVVRGRHGLDAERVFTIDFDDRSVATLAVTGRGDGVRGVQEQVEARRGPLTVHLDDLSRMRTSREGRVRRRRTLWRDKGHQRMYREMLGRFQRGEPATYPLADLVQVCRVQLTATDLVRSSLERRPVAPSRSIDG